MHAKMRGSAPYLAERLPWAHTSEHTPIGGFLRREHVRARSIAWHRRLKSPGIETAEPEAPKWSIHGSRRW